MITKEAIILAGGLGTRLQNLFPDTPKSMALIGEAPFLSYLLRYLEQQSIQRVVLSVGHKYESIQKYFGYKYESLDIEYAVENEPLGTGGAISNSLNFVTGDNVFVFNGDTIFDIVLKDLSSFYEKVSTDLLIALKSLKDFERYGTVTFDESNKIIGFKEKQPTSSGQINGGVYLLNKNLFSEKKLPEKFSFEKDIMEAYFAKEDYYALQFDNYFLDIGVPEDYAKAQHEFSRFKY